MKKSFHSFKKFSLCLFFSLFPIFFANGSAVGQSSPEESWLGSFGETWGQNVSDLQESMEKILYQNQEIDGDNQRLSQEIRRWQKNIQELTLAINSLKPQKKRFENILREKNPGLDTLKQKYSVLNQRYKKVDEKAQSLINQAEFEKRQEQLLKKDRQRLVNERAALREQKNFHQQSEGQSVNAHKSQERRLQGILDQALKSRADLDQRLVYLQKEAFETSEKLRLMEEKINNLQANLTTIEKDASLIELKRKDLEEQKDGLKVLGDKENQNLEQDIVRAQRQKNLLKKSYEQLSQELERISQIDPGENIQGFVRQFEEAGQENLSLKDQIFHLQKILSESAREKESIKRSLLER